MSLTQHACRSDDRLSPLDSPWLRSLPPDLRGRLLEGARDRRYEKGRLIGVQGEIAEGLLANLAGQVEVTHWLGSDSESLIDLAGPGRWLGFESVLGQPARVSWSARTEVEALLIPRTEVEPLLVEDPRCSVELLRVLARENADLISWVSQQLMLAPEDRVRGRLASLAERERGERGDLSGAVALSISQSDLAAMAGLSRQTTNGLLRRLAERGVIELSFCRILIPDPAALLAEAGSRETSPAVV